MSELIIAVTTNYSNVTNDMVSGLDLSQDVNVDHHVPQLSHVLSVALDKDSAALAFSFERGRGTPRRVVRTDVKLLFLSLCLGVWQILGCAASQCTSSCVDCTPYAHHFPVVCEVTW